jgi:hypothetical protein
MERNPYNSPYDTDTRRERDEEPVPESPEPLAEEAHREGDRLVAGERTPGDAHDDPDATGDRDPLSDPFTTSEQDTLDDPHATHKDRLNDPDATTDDDRLNDPYAAGDQDRLNDPLATAGQTDSDRLDDQFGDGSRERTDVHDGPGPVHQPVTADGTPLTPALSDESDARFETPDDVLAPDSVTVPEQRVAGDVYPQEIDFDARWHDIKAGFVDDPRDSVEKADALIDEAVSALAARRQALVDGWKNGDQNDTEQLRLALREYRSLFDKLKG